MSQIERLRLPEDDATFGSNRIFDLFQYSTAVTANGLVFIAGQIGLRADGTIPQDPQEQIDVAFKRIEAVLEHLGLDFTDVVELVSYHVDVGSQLAAFREVKERYIRSDFPAWTILGVAALARPELIVEIKVVAATRS
ncbi:RidA family protein [Paraburkholderia silviterrae]|uniref:RidA family protein n=1 Tax=Paraburkholderia silviterrae TaxID=2528715 RepID=A0A4R5MGN7_9BURK|nr:RidA family protein [Paraburkholderia silviterrae]TDG26046.1 RidA family protein [Paraburkholderia silviterrae]